MTYGVSDLRQTENYSIYIKNLGWYAEKFADLYIYRKELLFWSFIKIQRPQTLEAKPLLDHLKRNYRFSTVYIEPTKEEQYNELLKFGFRKYNSPFLPSKTVQIDLTNSEEELLKKMHYKTRYNIKKISNIKLQISKSRDIERFAEFWQKCARKRGMFLSQIKEIKSIYEAFGSDAIIHVAIDENGDWLSAILRISSKNISYYMYAASNDLGKKLYAPTLLTWHAILCAKKEGKKLFDFEGVYDERFPLNSWKGFTRFKQSFGGKIIEYPGCVSKVLI